MGSDGWPISALESAGLRWLRPAGRLPGLPASAASVPAPAAAAAASVLLQRQRGLPASAASRLRQPEGAWQQHSVPARPNEQADERREAAAGAASAAGSSFFAAGAALAGAGSAPYILLILIAFTSCVTLSSKATAIEPLIIFIFIIINNYKILFHF